MRFEQPIDKVQAARPARPGARREITCEHCLGAGCEPGALFVPNMDPLDIAAPDCIGDEVKRVARPAPAMFHTGRLQRFHDNVSDSFGHLSAPFEMRIIRGVQLMSSSRTAASAPQWVRSAGGKLCT